MTVSPLTSYTVFPSFNSHAHKPSKQPPQLDLTENNFDVFRTKNMANPGSPYIKDEPEDFNFNSGFMGHNGYSMPQSFGSHHFGNTNGGINPSELTMSGSMSRSFTKDDFGAQNMSNGMGNSTWAEDELAELDAIGDPHGPNANYMVGGDHFNQQSIQQFDGYGSMAINHQGNSINHIYSHTPDGQPIMSPAMNGQFNFEQYRPVQQQSQSYHAPAGVPNGAFDLNGRPRSKMHPIDRNQSNSRSPMTPKTPALNGLQLSTPDSGSFPGQTIITNQPMHRQQKSVSGQWDGTPGSGGSWIDSPLPSPHQGPMHGGQMHHPQITEVLGTGKHASLPTKVERSGHSASMPGAFQTQEAKRRRRRESHNLVERRRRDNINERIQDLSRLVPQHRLEDEKVRKHINNNGPLSPSLTATGISPPQATSLLAGGTGRRAAGSITTGLPIEEKDKGPNKGDILNGAVGWTRDLMWILYEKYQQEDQLKEQFAKSGNPWPWEMSEDEKRMRSELVDAVEKNNVASFTYSRAPGSGLRVPKHTNIAGDPLSGSVSPQSLSPANRSARSATTSSGQGTQQSWMANYSGSAFKEEDEYNMEM